MRLKEIIESSTQAILPNGKRASFNMNKLASEAWPLIEGDINLTNSIRVIDQMLGGRYFKGFKELLLRNVFLIELVNKPTIETTIMRVRWIDELDNDPRGCSFEECYEILKQLIHTLPDWINQDPNSRLEIFKISYDFNLIPYEAPLDYFHRSAANERIHTLGNLNWFSDEITLRTLQLRKLLLDAETSPDRDFFDLVLKDKIKVKTYLTDRVLTGQHKTNREKRWECHPNSVHFSERKVCMAVEYVLATQLCQFEGFPTETLLLLQKIEVLSSKLTIAVCPITGDELSYELFRAEVDDPRHGKSDFQVGHLNPLKLNEEGAESSGHTAANISWISADGNRIQGSLSLNDVRLMIARIKLNYDKLNWWPKKKLI